jgi:hypothetical protein
MAARAKGAAYQGLEVGRPGIAAGVLAGWLAGWRSTSCFPLVWRPSLRAINSFERVARCGWGAQQRAGQDTSRPARCGRVTASEQRCTLAMAA